MLTSKRLVDFLILLDVVEDLVRVGDLIVLFHLLYNSFLNLALSKVLLLILGLACTYLST